jgi:hypothetical protein
MIAAAVSAALSAVRANSDTVLLIERGVSLE